MEGGGRRDQRKTSATLGRSGLVPKRHKYITCSHKQQQQQQQQQPLQPKDTKQKALQAK